MRTNVIWTVLMLGCGLWAVGCSDSKKSGGGGGAGEGEGGGGEGEGEEGEGEGAEALDCGAVDAVAYDFGGSSGPCGPNNGLRVYRDGRITTSATEANMPAGSNECAEAVVREHTMDAVDAQALLDAVCADYNDDPRQPRGDCADGAYHSIALMGADEPLVPAVQLHCGGGVDMSTSRVALRELWQSLPTGPACQDRDASTCNEDNGCQPVIITTPCAEPPCEEVFEGCFTPGLPCADRSLLGCQHGEAGCVGYKDTDGQYAGCRASGCIDDGDCPEAHHYSCDVAGNQGAGECVQYRCDTVDDCPEEWTCGESGRCHSPGDPPHPAPIPDEQE